MAPVRPPRARRLLSVLILAQRALCHRVVPTFGGRTGIVVISSPARSNPCTEMIWRTLGSTRFVEGLDDAPIVIVLDGYRTPAQLDADRAARVKSRLKSVRLPPACCSPWAREAGQHRRGDSLIVLPLFAVAVLNVLRGRWRLRCFAVARTATAHFMLRKCLGRRRECILMLLLHVVALRGAFDAAAYSQRWLGHGGPPLSPRWMCCTCLALFSR